MVVSFGSNTVVCYVANINLMNIFFLMKYIKALMYIRFITFIIFCLFFVFSIFRILWISMESNERDVLSVQLRLCKYYIFFLLFFLFYTWRSLLYIVNVVECRYIMNKKPVKKNEKLRTTNKNWNKYCGIHEPRWIWIQFFLFIYR